VDRQWVAKRFLADMLHVPIFMAQATYHNNLVWIDQAVFADLLVCSQAVAAQVVSKAAAVMYVVVVATEPQD
jgi:hypothetical protein